MNFKKLSIKNFGCFIGDHTFNFASANDNKNITLIQGKITAVKQPLCKLFSIACGGR